MTLERIGDAHARFAYEFMLRLYWRWPTIQPDFRVEFVDADSTWLSVSVPWTTASFPLFSYESVHHLTVPLEDLGWFRAAYVREAGIVYVSPKTL